MGRIPLKPSSHEITRTEFVGATDNRVAAREDASRVRLALWLTTPLLTGATIMAQELVAFRLYAPYFGYSIYVWGSLISVAMAALALGYALGGQIADRSRTEAPLYGMLLGSAVYQLGVLSSSTPCFPSLLTWETLLGPRSRPWSFLLLR
jgi:hypothetical protein